jgi:hypothetical protein
MAKAKNSAERTKKGQAAFEYLVTYGWALILIFGIIAILYAYVFKPEFYVAESCDMAPGIDCGSFMLMLSPSGGDMVLNLSLRNGMEFEIEPQEVNITVNDLIEAGEKTYSWQKGRPGSSECADECSATVPSSAIGRGEMPMTFWFELRGKDPPRPGSLQRMKFSMVYKITDTRTDHRTAGILNVKVS